MTDLVIFDCDGVLVDSELPGTRAEVEALREIGIAIDCETLMRRFMGTQAAASHRILAEEQRIALPDDFEDRVQAKTDVAFRRELRAIEGVGPVLDALERKGPARCVASSGTYRRLGLSLGLTGLYERFRPHVFSAESVATGKPAPDLFLFAAERMSVTPARCLVVEDSDKGVHAAVAAGMPVVGFLGGSHRRPEDGPELLAVGAERVLADMTELLALIEALPDR